MYIINKFLDMVSRSLKASTCILNIVYKYIRHIYSLQIITNNSQILMTKL